MEFLANPYVNALIEAFAASNATPDDLNNRAGMEPSLASTIGFVEEWMAANGIEGEDAVSLLQMALFPYRVD